MQSRRIHHFRTTGKVTVLQRHCCKYLIPFSSMKNKLNCYVTIQNCVATRSLKGLQVELQMCCINSYFNNFFEKKTAQCNQFKRSTNSQQERFRLRKVPIFPAGSILRHRASLPLKEHRIRQVQSSFHPSIPSGKTPCSHSPSESAQFTIKSHFLRFFFLYLPRLNCTLSSTRTGIFPPPPSAGAQNLLRQTDCQSVLVIS